MDAFKSAGNAAFKSGSYKEAIEQYTKALEHISHTDEAAAALFSNRAASHSALGNNAEALADAERCIVAKPGWVKGPFRKGVALEAMGRYNDAEKALEQALKLDTANEDIQDRLNKIRSLVKESQKKSPTQCKTAEEAKTIGNAYFKDGKYDQALEYYTRAVDMTPDTDANKVNYYNNRAACHNQTHNYPQVIADTTSALALEPNNAKAMMRRGYAYKGMEKWKKALEDFQAVQAISPSPQVSQEISRIKSYLA